MIERDAALGRPRRGSAAAIPWPAEPNATGGPAPRCRPSRKARSTAGCEGWRPNSRRGGMGSLKSSRPASFLSESAARADRPWTIRGFPPSYRSKEPGCTPRWRESGSVRGGSAPMRLGGRRTLGSVVPGSVIVVGPVVPGSLVAIVRVVPGLRRSAAPADIDPGGTSGSGAAAGRGARARGSVAAGRWSRPCRRTRRAAPAARAGGCAGERRSGRGGRHPGGTVVRVT